MIAIENEYRLIEQEADTIKTHEPEAPKPPFVSRFGVSYQQSGSQWKVYCVGFLVCVRETEEEARDKAEQLEVLEASHAGRRTRSNVA